MNKDSKMKKAVKTSKKTVKKPKKTASKQVKKPVVKKAVKKTVNKASKPVKKAVKPVKKAKKTDVKQVIKTPPVRINKEAKPETKIIPEAQPVIPEKKDASDDPEQDLSLPEGSVYQQTGQRRPLIVFPK